MNCSKLPTSSSSQKKKRCYYHQKRSRLTFGTVQVREYPRIVGDNPACSSGVPMSMDWCHYPESEPMSLDEYEGQKSAPRLPIEFLLSPRIRHEKLLNEWGCTITSMAKAIQDIKQIKSQRHKAAKKASRIFKVEKVRSQLSRLGSIKTIFQKNAKISENIVNDDFNRGCSTAEMQGILKNSNMSISSFYIEEVPSFDRTALASIWSGNDDLSMSYKHGVKVQ